MNRTNAQSSCERRKTEMEEFEEILRLIIAEATKLRLENKRLKARIHQLEQKPVKDQDCCSLLCLSTDPPNLLEKMEQNRITIQNAEHNATLEPCFVCINNNRWVGDQNRYSIINTSVCTNHACTLNKSEKTSESVLQQKYRYNNGEEDQYPVIGSVFQI